MKTSLDWNPERIGSLSGRRYWITGANNGIGYQTALELARRGATVVMACRRRDSAMRALVQLTSQLPDASVEIRALDLASLDSVRHAAQEELATGLPLHGLINNAGVMAPPRRLTTADGFELQFGTNVLGHFLLTALLFPRLVETPGSRVVTVASIAHKRGRIRFEDLQSEADYQPMASYAQSKLANLMLALELERRRRRAELDVRSLACHPGVAATNLFQTGERGSLERWIRRLFTRWIGRFLQDARQGALPTLYAATADGLEGGGYYGPQGFREMRGGDVGRAQIRPHALDLETSAELWGVCEQLCGQRFLS